VKNGSVSEKWVRIGFLIETGIVKNKKMCKIF
jgi:hypothetical protein